MRTRLITQMQSPTVCLLMLLAAYARAAPELPFVLGFGQSNTIDYPNTIARFDPVNVSHVYAEAPFPFLQGTVFGAAVDSSRGRYFLLTIFTVVVYDAITLQQTAELPLPYTTFPPMTLLFDPPSDMLWTVYNNDGQSIGFWDKSASTAGHMVLRGQVNGSFVQNVDAAALDVDARILWVNVVESTSGNQTLFGFHVDSHQVLARLSLADACTGMRVGHVQGLAVPVCYAPRAGVVGWVDPKTGAWTAIKAFVPGLTDPAPLSATVQAQPDRQSSVYWVQSPALFAWTWLGVDVRTGAVVHQSQSADGLPNRQLGGCAYVSSLGSM